MKRSFFDVQCGDCPRTVTLTPATRLRVAVELVKVTGGIMAFLTITVLALAALPF